MRAERVGATGRSRAMGRSGRTEAGKLNGTGSTGRECVKGVKEE